MGERTGENILKFPSPEPNVLERIEDLAHEMQMDIAEAHQSTTRIMEILQEPKGAIAQLGRMMNSFATVGDISDLQNEMARLRDMIEAIYHVTGAGKYDAAASEAQNPG